MMTSCSSCSSGPRALWLQPTALRPRLRSFPAIVSVVAMVVAACVVSGGSLAGAQTPAPAVPFPAAKASVVVDARTGAVLQASNDRTPVAVASAIKILTALVVHPRVKATELVPISKRAASMPYLKMSAKAGQRWRADGLLHAMLLASANDAAVALAERAGGGTTAGYVRLFRSEARALHLQDSPTLQDPAGLDDEFSVGGGNLISARDMAIVARAFLAQPDLASIARLTEYRFAGGDGRPHRVVSHDRFLRTYPGAIGIKTGHTERSGYTLVAAARRGNRTLIAVVVQSANTVQEASNLLDAGFAQVQRGRSALGQLPAPGGRPERVKVGSGSRPRLRAAPSTSREPDRAPLKVPASNAANEGFSATGAVETVLVVLVVLGVLVVLRRRQVRRRRALARRRRRQTRAGQPRSAATGSARRH